MIPRCPNGSSAHANSTQSCRPGKPFFRRGSCVRKLAYHLEGSKRTGFSAMKREKPNLARLSLAGAGMAVSAVMAAALWPHASDAWAVLAAQDDPAELSNLQVSSALRNNSGLIHDNIEAALASGDADLAGSFAELARNNNITLSEEVWKGGSDAVTEENSGAQFAKGFATGLVTGNADDVASLSGTVAGDLFVFGDIRDVVREGKHLAMG